MKKLFFLSVFTLAMGTINAQNEGYLWQPNPQICNPYNAEQDAVKYMAPSVQALYNATQTQTDTYLDAARNIYCNPPKVSTQSPTPTPTPSPSYNYNYYGTARKAN